MVVSTLVVMQIGSNFPPKDCKKVNDERACLSLGKKKGDCTKNSFNLKNQLKQLKKENARHKRTIASLKSDPSDQPEETADNKDIEQDTDDSFGGKKSKKWLIGLSEVLFLSYIT